VKVSMTELKEMIREVIGFSPDPPANVPMWDTHGPFDESGKRRWSYTKNVVTGEYHILIVENGDGSWSTSFHVKSDRGSMNMESTRPKWEAALADVYFSAESYVKNMEDGLRGLGLGELTR